MDGDTYSEVIVRECSTSEEDAPVTARETVDMFFIHPSQFDRRYGGCWATCANTTTILMIVASQVILLVETAPPYYLESEEGEAPWSTLEIIIVAWFSLELVLRFYGDPDRSGFCKDPLNIADMLAVFPFYLELALSTHISFNFKIFRLLRAVRMIKISRFHNGLKIVGRAIRETIDQLFMGFVIIVICLFLFSSFVYYLERSSLEYSEAHGVWYLSKEVLVSGPQGYYLEDVAEESSFQSIPHTFWWCITTLTTVGYGDAVPSSPWAKVVASLTMVTGVFVLSLPTSIIGSKFLELYNQAQRAEEGETEVSNKAKKDTEVVELLVFIDELVARGKLSTSQAYSDESGEVIIRPGDAEEIRNAAFQDCFFDDIRSVFLAAKKAPTEDLTIERFTRGMLELNLQRKHFMKPKRTQYRTPWAPSNAALKRLGAG
eukprot:TRINITY_DN29877_c0_g1_i1.p1 TRINITY_DN29877_c0_g1~~TRINITY_DN29877_c0_g1_i1.p1  ORF type:complete len:443 (+),score=141.31 TRINITY_DN29877_c0_g1_i1:35-1330(+)